nr:type II toxin-antitoxin system RelE/ParE family toxin [Roseomonas haemaphysalidis]
MIRYLSRSDKIKVGDDLKTVELGWPIGMPVCRPMGNGLNEVRTTLSNNRELRILFFVQEQEAVLLHAFFKKTQQTPKQDLALARARMRECKVR